ncbi:MAG: hypothetical protein H6531_09130 [Actinobacteria bacterium]|nr:hypothetical protein [Actinomycetota bacterium]
MPRSFVNFCALALLCLAPAALAGDTPSMTPGATDGGSSARELAVRRDPNRLWYRFEVTFEGTRTVTGTQTFPGGVSQASTSTVAGGYTMTSRAATIMTRRCVVRARGREVFSVARSCRDARRIPRVRRNRGWLRLMREEFGFRANLTGRINGGRIVGTGDPAVTKGLDGLYVACPSSARSSSVQAAPQPASGSLGTVGGTSAGVIIAVTADPDTRSSALVSREAVTCPGWKVVDGVLVEEMYTTPAISQVEESIWHPLDEHGKLNGLPLQSQRKLRIKPAQFGKTITKRWKLSGPLVPGNIGEMRRYTYTLKMIPCPGGGRRVRGC